MAHKSVRDYYDSFGEREWTRLENPDDGVVEFAITCRTVAKYLLPGSRVLDVGGGPGRYSVWLAGRGHRVVLADLSPELLSIARTKIELAESKANIEEIAEADACDLSRWTDKSFDAVLSLGPFYHLPDANERRQAVEELKRVLRPKGIAFIALMPRYAFLRRTLAIPDERRHIAQPEFVSNVLERGAFYNDIPGRFTNGYGVRPEEVLPFFEGHGFETLTLLAAEGIVRDNQRSLDDLRKSDPAMYDAALGMVLRTAYDHSIFGMAAHLLYVGRKR